MEPRDIMELIEEGKRQAFDSVLTFLNHKATADEIRVYCDMRIGQIKELKNGTL